MKGKQSHQCYQCKHGINAVNGRYCLLRKCYVEHLNVRCDLIQT